MREDLLRRAAQSCRATKSRPRLVFLRRAVSDAYYALFHGLALHCADEFVGASKRKLPAWARVYRSVTHVQAKDELNRNEVKRLCPTLESFANAFVRLQAERHRADYDPGPFDMNRRDVEALLALARSALADLDSLDPDMKKQLAAIVLTKRRPQ